MIFKRYPGGARVKAIHPGEGNTPLPGSTKQLIRQSAEQLKANTRLAKQLKANRRLEILEMNGKLDSQLVI